MPIAGTRKIVYDKKVSKGNTAQRMCGRCANRFFVRLHRNDAGILAYCKEFLCDMTENSSADAAHSRQAGFVRCCLKSVFQHSFRPLSSVSRSFSDISAGISTSIPSLRTIISCGTAGSAFSGSAPPAIHCVFMVAVAQVTL